MNRKELRAGRNQRALPKRKIKVFETRDLTGVIFARVDAKTEVEVKEGQTKEEAVQAYLALHG